MLRTKQELTDELIKDYSRDGYKELTDDILHSMLNDGLKINENYDPICHKYSYNFLIENHLYKSENHLFLGRYISDYEIVIPKTFWRDEIASRSYSEITYFCDTLKLYYIGDLKKYTKEYIDGRKIIDQYYGLKNK